MDRVVVKNTFIHDFAETSESTCTWYMKPRSASVPVPARRQPFHESAPSSPEESDAEMDSEEMFRGCFADKDDRECCSIGDVSTDGNTALSDSPRSISSCSQGSCENKVVHGKGATNSERRTETDRKGGKKGSCKGNNKGTGKGGKRGANEKHQCWIPIGIVEERKFGVRQRIVGNCGGIANLSAGTKLRLRGRGSKFLEENGKEADCDLMLCISCKDPNGYKEVIGAVRKLLTDIYRHYQAYCLSKGLLCPHLELTINEGRRPEGRRPGSR